MNYKAISVVIFVLAVILAILNISLFYLFSGKNKPTFTLNSSSTVTAPVAPNSQGVNTFRLLYLFKGKVTEVKPMGNNFLIKLDISNSSLPEFIVTRTAIIFDSKKPGIPIETSVDDVHVGSKVEITDSYDPKTQKWEVNIVTVKADNDETPAQK